MSWILPGTVLRVDSDSPAAAEETLSAMFLTGGTLVFYYLPTLLLSAVPCGLLTGVCASGLLKKL